MTYRALSLALILGSTALPLACSSDDTTSNGTGGAGAAGKSGASGAAGNSGKAGASGTPTGGVNGTGTGGTGFGGGGRVGGLGEGGRRAAPGVGGNGNSEDPGVAERLPYCRAVCAYGPSSSARPGGDAGAGGEGGAAGGAAGAGGVAEAGGEGGAGGGTPCGNLDGCLAALCPTQATPYCGVLLTQFAACMAQADPALVASLVTTCTDTEGPSLDTLIYQACYGEYADWIRGCL